MNLSPLFHNCPPEGELLPQEQAAFELLRTLDIPYDRVSGDPADDMEKCRAVEQVLGSPICKNLFLCNRQRTAFYLLLIEGDKVFKTKYLSAQLGCARLSFAPPEDMERLLGVTPGSATVLGLMNDTEHRVHLLIDRPVYEAEYLSCHPCICTSSLKLKTSDVLTKLLPHTGHTPRIVDLPDTIE